MQRTNTTATPSSQHRDLRLQERRLCEIALFDSLEDAEYDLLHGKVTSARLSITECKDAIINAGRLDLNTVAELRDLPPMWQIEAAAAPHRKKILARYLPNGTFHDDGSYRELNPDVDHEIIVWPNDTWTASMGMRDFRVGGTGLPFLVAYLTGKLPELVALDWANRLQLMTGPK